MRFWGRSMGEEGAERQPDYGEETGARRVHKVLEGVHTRPEGGIGGMSQGEGRKVFQDSAG